MAQAEKEKPVAESKMEELQMNGLSGVLEDDWCADAQKAVITGADGLWIRCGPKPGPSLVQQMFAFQFNPCVSFFAVVLLFSLVGFCCIQPGNFCTAAVETYTFKDAGFVGMVQKAVPQPATKDYPTGTNTKLKILSGVFNGTGAKEDEFYAQLDSTAKTMKVQGQTYTVTIGQRLENQECFMPKKEFDDWMAWVTECFTWLYIITQNVWIAFAVWLCFSKYGKVKLGRDEDEPEFTYFAWFSMLFTCGVATGLFYFAVTEPQYYYLTSNQNDGYYERNRWTYSGVYVDTAGKETGVFNTPNNRAQHAMTTTWYHWGLHGWVCYCLLGILLAFLHFRKGLPMTIKSCFYPLLGMRVYGFLGDFLDTISVVATTMGVCTSLGLGVMQLNTGLEQLNGDQHWMGEGYYNSYSYPAWQDRVPDLKKYWDSWDQSLQAKNPWYDAATGNVMISTAASVAKVEAQGNQQMLLIWIITASATCSVMLGLKNGIKQLALLCLALGQFVIFYVWMMDDTWFITNLFVQTLGHYIGELPTLGFYASAVEQSEVNNPYGEYASWQFWWTIFYWGWWIAWAPFVGVFLARVGKARTVKEFIFCTLFSACIYNFIFMTVLGGAGLKMQMLAEKHDVGTPKGGGCNDKKLVIDPAGNYLTLSHKKNVCRATSTRKYSGEKEMFCSTVTNLGCSLAAEPTRPLFDVMTQYADTAKGMTVILLITITLYFVASSDSGSMVDDMITANGLPEPCLSQRLFWALTEGAAATALLSIGKYVGAADGGLKALRSASICVGLPYTFLICFMCVSLYRALQYEVGDRTWGSGFRKSVMDIGITVYGCGPSLENGERVRLFNGKRGSVDFRKILQLLIAFVAPGVPLWQLTDKMSIKRFGSAKNIGTKVILVACTVLFATWFLLMWIDYAPISSNLQEWGSIMGNASDINGNSRYYLSNRWGYYHQWANKDSERDVGTFIKWNTDVDYKGQEKPLSVSINGVSTDVGVGERMAFNYRIATIGWFFFFLFVVYLTGLRSEVRSMKNIPGTLSEDFMVCCFWPCAIWQMNDEMDAEDCPKVEDRKVDEI